MVFGISEYIALLALAISIGTATISWLQARRMAQDADKSAAIATRRGHLTELLLKLLELENEWTVITVHEASNNLTNIDVPKEKTLKPTDRAAHTIESAAILRRVNGLYRAYFSNFELVDRQYLQTVHSVNEPLSNNQLALEFIKKLQSTTQKALEKLNN